MKNSNHPSNITEQLQFRGEVSVPTLKNPLKQFVINKSRVVEVFNIFPHWFRNQLFKTVLDYEIVKLLANFSTVIRKLLATMHSNPPN